MITRRRLLQSVLQTMRTTYLALRAPYPNLSVSGARTQNWGKMVTFIQFLANEPLGSGAGAFADDVYFPEPLSESRDGFRSAILLAIVITTHRPPAPSSGRKDHVPPEEIVLPGALIRIGGESTQAAIRHERILKIQGRIAHALQLNCLSPGAASKLRGRIGLSTSILVGELRRGGDGEVDRWPVLGPKTQTDARVDTGLVWLYSDIGGLHPRVALSP